MSVFSAPLELRPFDRSQLAELTELWIASWRKAMPEIDFEARRGWFADHLRGLVDAGVLVEVATGEDGHIAGFVTIDRTNGHVDQLAVHPDHWGSGVAEVLIRSAAARAGRPIVLEVNEENARAVRFYERTGFTVTGRGANPLSGRPTLHMEWRPDFLVMKKE
jgi:putative acetyltransferase